MTLHKTTLNYGDKTMSEPSIIQYTNLLHRYRDPEAKQVKAFVDKHKDDKVFLRRTKALNKLFSLKKELADV